jgi:hypothetical protein
VHLGRLRLSQTLGAKSNWTMVSTTPSDQMSGGRFLWSDRFQDQLNGRYESMGDTIVQLRGPFCSG